jgi:hypothetical protein
LRIAFASILATSAPASCRNTSAALCSRSTRALSSEHCPDVSFGAGRVAAQLVKPSVMLYVPKDFSSQSLAAVVSRSPASSAPDG